MDTGLSGTEIVKLSYEEAYQQLARNGQVVIAAADLDQSRDRVFRAVKYAVENCPTWRGSIVYRDIIELDNGSTIQALPQDWRGASGGDYSAVIFDELHTYSLEYQRRLYDELTIPPTRVHGVRWIASYAGFTGESKLLEEVWNLAQAGGLEPGILPIYYNQGASLLALIDQGELSWRMPWTTPEYMKEVQASERPNTYRRLWLNEWVASESAFLPPGAWEACRDVEVMPLGPGDRRRPVFGLDASAARDTTAVVGCLYDAEHKLSDVVYCRIWKPQKGQFRDGKPNVAAFGFFGGVPLSILYDNLKIGVAKICGDGRRERTRAFTELVSHTYSGIALADRARAMIRGRSRGW